MISEAIILAGGFGTRLTSVKDVPKSMAPINDVPFLQILLDDLLVKGITTFYLAVGHQHEVIVDYFGTNYMGCKIHYIIEDEPLGTGGAIKQALTELNSENVFILNGDTFFDVDLEAMYQLHTNKNANVTIALKPLHNFDRYGQVMMNLDGRITNFSEKQFCEQGLINGGVYLLQTNLFDGLDFPQQFSIEQDYFVSYCPEKIFYGYVSDGYFIDIGIPEDYQRAQEEL